MNLRLSSLPALLAVALIRLYQVTLSSLLGGRCRFYPSCSHYGIQAIQTHGLLKGAWLALARLARCHPLHAGGVDLVPPRNPGVFRHFAAHGDKQKT